MKAASQPAPSSQPVVVDFSVYMRERFFQLILRARQAVLALKQDRNPEAVHGLRVALRRLRAALRAIRPVTDNYYLQSIDASIKEIAALSGEARDLEVMIETIEALPGLADDTRAALAPWLEGMRARERETRGGLKARLEERDILLPLKQLRAYLVLPARPDKKTAVEIALGAVDVVLRPVARDLKKIRKRRGKTPWLHGLRIKCKRLRYGTEFFQDLLPEVYRDVARSARIMQNRLGELHDHDFILARLGRETTLDAGTRAALESALRERRAEILERTIRKSDEHRRVLARFA